MRLTYHQELNHITMNYVTISIDVCHGHNLILYRLHFEL